ncbi:hypothetical protein [Catenulispora sp. GP43]|uniref:hypothetical protein n=1 Tax=Catenulispora sp. GP43 TaxID=3156263 RepID=UPI003517288E
MKRRRSAALLVGSAAIMLCAGCGSGATQAASTAAVPTGAAAPTAAASTASPSTDTTGRKPCSHPTAMSGFLKLDSAQAAQGGTRLSVTIVSCTVDPVNDEDVDYTPTRTDSYPAAAGAQIQVLAPDNNLQTVAAAWLVSHQVVNTPYFYYQDDAQHQITALQEIYHP